MDNIISMPEAPDTASFNGIVEEPMQIIVVHAAYDPDANVWWTESSDLHGLNVEADTLEGLRDQLPGAVADLLDTKTPGETVAIEIVARAHTKVKIPAAA